MKAQFKYAFLAGFHIRGPVFAVIFIMNTVFLILGLLGLLPFAALVTAVSLGGVAIAVMFTANIGSDVAIISRLFSAQKATLYALTPAPRWKTLLASITTMTVMDVITMAFVIITQVSLSFNLTGNNVRQIFWSYLNQNLSGITFIIWNILLLIAGYLLVLMVILFCITAKKSIFFKMPASGFLAFLLACACFYIASLLQILLAPFGVVERFLFMITITLDTIAIPLLALLTLLEAGVLFVLTSKLMERKINL